MPVDNCTSGGHACIPAACLTPEGGNATIPRETLQALIWAAGTIVRRLSEHADARHPSAVDIAVIDSTRVALINAAAALRMSEGPRADPLSVLRQIKTAASVAAKQSSGDIHDWKLLVAWIGDRASEALPPDREGGAS